MKLNGRKPNFLFILVDEERYPPVYETEAIKAFRQEQLPARVALREHAVEFHRHYAASTACAPSRASLFTGHYPSLHGVTQTDGLAKRAWDPDMFWLEPNTVPTMGDYFRAAGYRTYYKGKWHISEANIQLPDSHDLPPTWDKKGQQLQGSIDEYLQANPLDAYGFSEWIGPEPHGKGKANTGINRDPAFAQQTCDLLDRLEGEYKHSPEEASPWLVVSSFINPHDIVLFGLLWLTYRYRFSDSSIPVIPSAPMRQENLSTKPGCQKSYVDTYGKMYLPQPTNGLYRKFYYYLHKRVDEQIRKVYDRLKNSPFYENTIVIFTSDHGEMLGAHGGFHQKWHNAYEESIHVPLVISNPVLFKEPRAVHAPTSHADLLPTMLGLAGADSSRLESILCRDHSEVHPLVGRDLSGMVLGNEQTDQTSGTVYFMTDDEISEGQSHQRFKGNYDPIVQPNHVETVITTLKMEEGEQLWKYSRYFDNPEFWAVPGVQDTVRCNGQMETKTQPEPDQFEMYNLSADPLEELNLAYPPNESPASRKIREQLDHLLQEQRIRKRLKHVNSRVPQTDGNPKVDAV